MKPISKLILILTVTLTIGLFPYGWAYFDRWLGSEFGQSVSADTKEISTFLEEVPAYSGQPYVKVNGGKPSFTKKQKKSRKAFEKYSDLDELGRCGVAFANICTKLMPTEPRGSIGNVKPSGWNFAKYNGIVEGNYLYNRCHLIAFSLAGENANEKNLITGTRYLNVTGMLPFEDEVREYVKGGKGRHVLYRVTPVFDGENLVASGVQMEAWSVEDKGKGICFNIFAYNVQPGIEIDYLTGESRLASAETDGESEDSDADTAEKRVYVLNHNTKRFHKEDCSSVKDISPKNKEVMKASRQELIDSGYIPCGNCRP